MTRTTLPQGTTVRLAGVLDEHFERARFVELATGPVVLIDFDQVRRVTSFGVREWMIALSQLSPRYLGFINARPNVVSQFNMVAHFGEPGHLLSFFVPYLCPSCGRDHELLIDLRRDLELVQRFEVPPVKCPGCKHMLDFDDDPHAYYSYAAAAPFPAPPPEVEMLLGDEQRGLRVDKVIEGNITGVWLSGGLVRSMGFKRLADSFEGQVVISLENVASTTPEGLEQLGALLSFDGAEIFLTRVPVPRLARVVAERRGRARLLSVRGDLECPNGHRNGLDVDALFAEALEGGKVQPSCTTCNALLQIEPFLQLLEGMGLSPMPEPVAQFIKAHPYAPERAGSTPSGLTQLALTPPRGIPTGPGFFGRYELLRKLGAGGMAEVYLARLHAMGGFEKPVVLKRILPGLTGDKAFRDMLLAEARMAARISHPNVVSILDVGQLDDIFYIAMEYVEGKDLNRILRRAARVRRQFPATVAARIAAEICAGLHAAHSAMGPDGQPSPIIHRDVSPHNVLVGTAGQVKLTDFGIAKAIDSSNRTPSSTVKGKITYMAPELIRPGPKKFDHRVDIFPAAITLYQMLTLDHPFKRSTEYATLVAIVQDPIKDVRELAPEAPEALSKIVMRGLERSPDARYPTADEMRRDLEAWLASTGTAVGAAEVSAFVNAVTAESNAADGPLEPMPSPPAWPVGSIGTSTEE